MLTMQTKSEAPSRDFPDMSSAELDRRYREAEESFVQARAQKTEADRIYVAAATRLNTLDRMVKKEAQREVVNRRAAAKALLRTG
jgi:hypothetical protein